MTRLRGELVHWNDARGFGFVTGEDGQRYFVHISAIARIATRPRLGDTVSFVGVVGAKRQREARSVVIEGANPVTAPPRPARAKRDLDWQLLLALTLVALLAYAAWLEPPAIWLLPPYSLMGSLSFVMYSLDKRAAEAGAWRVPEARLHLFDLTFGIVGGLTGQSVFRHKTQKTRFMLVTLAIGFVHLALLAGVAIGEIKLQVLLSALSLLE